MFVVTPYPILIRTAVSIYFSPLLIYSTSTVISCQGRVTFSCEICLHKTDTSMAFIDFIQVESFMSTNLSERFRNCVITI